MPQDDKGTGKHPHKRTSEPHPHTKQSGGKEQSSQSHGMRASGAGASGSRGSQGSESSDLKSREYRDKDGNIHHHTHTAGKSEHHSNEQSVKAAGTQPTAFTVFSPPFSREEKVNVKNPTESPGAQGVRCVTAPLRLAGVLLRTDVFEPNALLLDWRYKPDGENGW
jgi:hypothetical protein